MTTRLLKVSSDDSSQLEMLEPPNQANGVGCGLIHFNESDDALMMLDDLLGQVLHIHSCDSQGFFMSFQEMESNMNNICEAS